MIKIGLFIIPFIPLHVSNSLIFPYITGKAFIFRTIVEIVFALWIFLAVFYKQYRPQKNFLLIAIGTLVFVAALATIFGVNPVKSMWSNFERMEGLITYLHLFAYFLVMGSVLQKSDWTILFNFFVAGGLFEGVYSFFQKLEVLVPRSFQGGFRVDGTIGNPSYLAAYLMFVFGFCVLLWINAKKKSSKYYYAFAGLFTLLIIFFTASRGPALGIIMGAFLAGLLYLIFKKSITDKERTYKKVAVILLVLLAAIIGSLLLLKDSKFVKSSEILARLTSLSFTERTISARFTIWGMSWQGVKERPVLGWGPENYGVVFSKYYQPELWWQEPWFDRAHNVVFDWLISAGILGLLSYLSIFATALYYLWKNYSKKIVFFEETLLITSLFFAYFFQNLFIFDNISTYICFFAILSYIYSVSTSERFEAPKSNSSLDANNVFLVGGLLAISLVLAVYFINIKTYISNRSLLETLKYQSQYSDLPISFDYFNKAFKNDVLNAPEIKEQLIKFAVGVNSLPAADEAFKAEVVKKAIEEGKKMVEQDYLEPRSYLFYGNALMAGKEFKEAEEIFNKAIELSPKKQQIYFELSDVFVYRGDYKSAIPFLEVAYNLDTRFEMARINLAAIYISAGEVEKAEKLLMDAYGTIAVPHEIIGAAYAKIKSYDKSIAVWKLVKESDPTSLRYRKTLAGIYNLAGQKENAIKEIEEAIAAFPEFKAAGTTYIEQIKSGKI